MRLGVETTTLDADGDVVRETEVDVSEADVVAAMRALVGESLQRPPAYSAVKVGGRKLYEAAREGERLEAEPRPIRVDAFDLVVLRGPGCRRSASRAPVGRTCACSRPTWAPPSRAAPTSSPSAATAIGPYSVDDAVAPDACRGPLPIEAAVGHLPRLDLDAEEAVAASHGRPLGPAGLTGPYGVFGTGRAS